MGEYMGEAGEKLRVGVYVGDVGEYFVLLGEYTDMLGE